MNKYTPEQTYKHRQDIENALLTGAGLFQIIALTGLNKNRVAKLIREIKSDWRKAGDQDFQAQKAEEIARLNRLEQEYWTAWFKSIREPAARVKARTLDGKIIAMERDTLPAIGNPRYLQGIGNCIELRCKILGVYTPKLAITDWRTQAAQVGIDPERLVGALESLQEEGALSAQFVQAMKANG